MSIPIYTLNNGVKIPAIGLGTFLSEPNDVYKAVFYALTETPIRHIDGAYAYENEHEVGRAIADAIKTGKITRKDIFVTTKVYMAFHKHVAEGFATSLSKLGLDYVDLLLIHWPVGFKYQGPNSPITRLPPSAGNHEDFDVVDNWKQLTEVYKSGKARAIGVSNYSIPVLERLLASEPEVIPAVNQIESQPLLPDFGINEYCAKKGIYIEAYCPLGRGSALLTNETVGEIAKKHGTEIANVLISWHVNAGRIALPKSITPARILSNATYIKLDKEDMAVLDKLYEKHGISRIVSPIFAPDIGFESW